jgi:hypothetical protein
MCEFGTGQQVTQIHYGYMMKMMMMMMMLKITIIIIVTISLFGGCIWQLERYLSSSNKV